MNRPLRRESLDAVVAPVRNEDVSIGVAGQTPRRIELAGLGAVLAPAVQVLAFGGEPLDAVIQSVANQQRSVRGCGNSGRSVELTRSVANVTPMADEISVGIKYVDPLQRLVGNENPAVSGAGDVAGPPELPIFDAAGAPLSDIALVNGADAHALVLQASDGFRAATIQHIHHAVRRPRAIAIGMDEPPASVGQEPDGVAIRECGGCG